MLLPWERKEQREVLGNADRICKAYSSLYVFILINLFTDALRL